MRKSNWSLGFALLTLALGASRVFAGYESVSAPKAERIYAAEKKGAVSEIVNRAEWRGGVVLPNGNEILLKNAGGYFLPIDLEPGVKCQMWFSGSGLVPGRQVTLFTMNGGGINGGVQKTIVVEKDARLRFDYQNGTFGAQPIHATIFGNTSSLLSVMAVKEQEHISEKEAFDEKR